MVALGGVVHTLVTTDRCVLYVLWAWFGVLTGEIKMKTINNKIILDWYGRTTEINSLVTGMMSEELLNYGIDENGIGTKEYEIYKRILMLIAQTHINELGDDFD